MRISQLSPACAIGAMVFLMLMGPAAFSNQARADVILVSAPSAGGSYYGMYCVSCVGAEFSLTGSTHISTIDVTLFTPAATSFTTFDFSLMSSATTTIASQALTAPVGAESTEVMNVDETLAAGTYYLVGNVPGYAGTTVTPGGVDGWVLSTGVYDETAGTITSGVGNFVGTTWTEYAPDASYTSPAFTVNGPSTTSTGVSPEPSTMAMLASGVLLLVGIRSRRTARSRSSVSSRILCAHFESDI